MPALLVLAETDGHKILPSTLPTIAFAQQWAHATGGAFILLAILQDTDAASELAGYGARAVRVAALLDGRRPTADVVAAIMSHEARQAATDSVAGPSSSFGRDVLPRVAALLDLPMLSDVLSVEAGEGGLLFRRPMYAGNVIATVQIDGDAGVYSVRTTAFDAPEAVGAASPVETASLPETLPEGTTIVTLESAEQKRPELTSARVVVSGGRPLKDAETFERLLGGLADRLGGAVGATRAAVDSGIAPNELQVGQTGKVVAPDLYIAAGVSGSVQHMAGMKDSKVIVAINNDPDAPIFEVADYGLVADLHQAIPELMEKL
jgi:electron transfer flavoprotein alpha subunit